MLYELLQPLITKTGKTREECVQLLTIAQENLSSVVRLFSLVESGSVYEKNTYAKINEITLPHWQQAIKNNKAFACDSMEVERQTDLPGIVKVKKSNLYNFDWNVWKNVKYLSIEGQLVDSQGTSLISINDNTDEYTLSFEGIDDFYNMSIFDSMYIFTPYLLNTGVSAVIKEMAEYDATATDTDRENLRIKSEKLKEYSYTKEKTDSAHTHLLYPATITSKIAALRKKYNTGLAI